MTNRMEELVTLLTQASDQYYNNQPQMSDHAYDALFNELLELERQSGVILPNSPTQNVGAQVSSPLRAVKHEYPALSLDKTKDMTEFPKVFNTRDQLTVVMWKLDGSTVQLTYNEGKLVLAATRGNGEEGSDITHNAPYIKGIPMTIPFKGKLVVRGEAVMSYAEFDRLNTDDNTYANARNLANATIGVMPGNDDIKNREINFFAFKLVGGDLDILPTRSFMSDLQFLENNGFAVVEHELADVSANPLKEYSALENVMTRFSNRVEQFDFPVDGLVVAANDVVYAETLPVTGHHPNALVGYAFKWQDEVIETELLNIEFNTTRTGQISLVAVFKPVQLEGTTVERATLHNLNFLHEVLGPLPFRGQKIWVYKANKIIPAIDHAEPSGGMFDGKQVVVASENIIRLPSLCPTCGSTLQKRQSPSGTENLYCINENCPSRKIQKFVHFCERDCMNIRGLSEAKIEFLINHQFILSDPHELYYMANEYHVTKNITNKFGELLTTFDGWGDKAVENLVAAIDKSRNVSFVNFMHAMGIPNVGKGQAKLLKKHLDSIWNEYEEEMQRELESEEYDLIGLLYLLRVNHDYDFRVIDGFGDVINTSLCDWIDTNLVNVTGNEIANGENKAWLIYLSDELTFTDEKPATTDIASLNIAGKTFVITGSVNHFKNRDELKEKIESLGGKTSGSVSKNTDYLINNDVTSTSGKNKKAKDLNIPIISEDDFLKMI